jgi:ATP-dependent DNA helicase Q1
MATDFLKIKDVVAQLKPLQDLHASLQSDRRALESRLANSFRPTKPSGLSQSSKSSLIDYQSPVFPWSSAILSTLKSTFDLPSFRLCQEGVINAAMDDRDIVCVMPTGGGKSLTYQLPAVIGGKGVTVVISPLLALIWDQVRALKEYGVECVGSESPCSRGGSWTVWRMS